MVSILLFFVSQFASIFLAFTYMPAMAFVGYQLLYFLYHESRWWYSSVPDIRYSFLISIFVVLFAVGTRARGRGIKLFDSPSIKWLAMLCIYFCVVNLWPLAPELHAFATEHYVKSVIIIFAALVLCDNKRALDLYLIAYVAGAAYIGYYTFEVGRNAGDRVSGVGTVDAPDINDMAAMLAPAAILALHLFWQAKVTWHRVLSVVAGGFIVNGMILMNSRGAFLGLVIGAAYYMYRLYFADTKIKNLRLKVIAIGLAGLAGLVVLVDQSALDRFTSVAERTEPTTEQETGSTRVFFWMAAVEMAKDHPFGRGFMSFTLDSHRYIADGVNTGRSRNRAVHSSWFQALAEVGFLGFTFLALALFSSWRMLVKARKVCSKDDDIKGFFVVVAIESACVSYIVGMSFLDRMRAEALHWLILFAAVAYQLYALKKGNDVLETNRELSPKLL